MTLIDAHVHFWDPGLLPYPWLAGVPAIASPHRPDALRAEAGEAMPRQLVFVQADCDRRRFLDEVRWVDGLARTEPAIAGIVAFAPLTDAGVARAAIEDLATLPRVRGVRHNIQDDPDPGLCRRASFVEGVRAVGRAGLCFDLCARATQLPDVLGLVAACPETRFVLDHAGKPAIGEGRIDPWRAHVEAIATFPHVVCKLSGLLTEAGAAAAHPEQAEGLLRPYVEHLIACFGPSRLLFGSDWPVVKLASSYRAWLEIARSLTVHLKPDAIRAIFCDNAKRTYRLA